MFDPTMAFIGLAVVVSLIVAVGIIILAIRHRRW